VSPAFERAQAHGCREPCSLGRYPFVQQQQVFAGDQIFQANNVGPLPVHNSDQMKLRGAQGLQSPLVFGRFRRLGAQIALYQRSAAHRWRDHFKIGGHHKKARLGVLVVGKIRMSDQPLSQSLLDCALRHKPFDYGIDVGAYCLPDREVGFNVEAGSGHGHNVASPLRRA